MAYTTLVELKKFLPEHIIVDLTDDYNTNTIEGEITDEAIAQAQTTIDTYMRGRYPNEISDADVPDFIQDMATKIAVYNLYRRKLDLTMPDTINDDYKDTLKMLRDIQSGKLTPFPAADEPVIIVSNKTSDSRTYSSSVLDSYNTIH